MFSNYWNEVIRECAYIIFYSVTMSLYYVILRKLGVKHIGYENLKLGQIVMIVLYAILIPVIAYGVAQKEVHLSMILCLLALALVIIPKKQEGRIER